VRASLSRRPKQFVRAGSQFAVLLSARYAAAVVLRWKRETRAFLRKAPFELGFLSLINSYSAGICNEHAKQAAPS
jgi:hypothetical protein